MSELNFSQDMFEDSCSSLTSPGKEQEWLGTNILAAFDSTTKDYVLVKASSDHTVLFKLPIKNGELEPYPASKTDRWDANHVRMPNSPRSLYPVTETRLEPRWPLIRNALRKSITSSKELESAIFSYNSKNFQKWAFEALHEFFSETLGYEETKYFFRTVFPGIVNLALDIENSFNRGIPFLKKGMNHTISMSQEQAAILLANAFLCTFPRRNTFAQNIQFPGINFNRLFQCGSLPSVQEKLKCFINYFRRVCKKRPQGVISFTKRCIKPNHLPIWGECESTFSKLYISSKGTIEEEGAGMLEIDFANKFVGGGVLGRGSVQEEIKFLICPELVVSRLFTECLDDNEALIVIGCERYNNYIGYGDTFSWAGNYVENEPKLDSYRRLNSVVVAIDATFFNSAPSEQYKLTAINRELNKAYTGFSFGSRGNIATGNWGCGAFKGDPKLKFLIQMMAASICKKNVAYFTFGDTALRDELFKMYEFIIKHKINVGSLWQILSCYYCTHVTKKTGTLLFDYIYDSRKSTEDTTVESTSKTGLDNSLPINDSEEDSFLKSNEPIKAPVNSLKTDEGRKRCIETDRERWEAYQDTMARLSNKEQKNVANNLSISKENAPVKRKISDYFTTYTSNK